MHPPQSTLNFRVTKEEQQTLQRAAFAKGTTQTALVRAWIATLRRKQETLLTTILGKDK